MNIYKILLDEGDFSDVEHHVLAKDFDDVVAQAHKLLDEAKERNKKAQIISTSLEIVGIKKTIRVGSGQMSEDCIAIDTYGYPQVTLGDLWARICFGWFFIDDRDENECASYIDILVDTKGNATYMVDVESSFHFDFVTPLRYYGHWENHGFGKYFVYADHHIPKRETLKHFIKNLPWRIKRWSYWHVPFFKRISNWRYQRYCRRLFKC